MRTSLDRIASLLLVAVALGCGGADREPAATILGHPADAARFEGGTALLQVHASGTRGLEYQWRKNGVDVPGATDSHYLTPPLAATDDGAVFTVVITNVGGPPVESNGARLTVYPPLDLRFKWVGAPFLPEPALGYGMMAGRTGPLVSRTYFNATGAPPVIGAGFCSSNGCTWYYEVLGAPGMEVSYVPVPLADLPADWASQLPGDTVVVTMDLEEGAGVGGLSWQRGSQTGAFTPVAQAAVAPDQLQAAATAEGAAGRVITAVSFLGGQVSYVAHGWSLAASATYEARVAIVPDLAGAGDAARAFAAEGYVITACGTGNEMANGIVLVGTRPTGQTAAREIVVTGDAGEIYHHVPMLAALHDASNTYLFIGER